MAGPIWHLITYDVRDAKRLRKTAKLLEGYGERIQYSVFRVRVNEHKREKLRWELSQVMSEEDHLLMIPLCNRCASRIDELSHGDHTDWAENPPTYDIL